MHVCEGLFDGGPGLAYRDAPCATPGTPATLGWLAASPVGPAQRPIYRCRWNAGAGTEEFLTQLPAECPAVLGTLLEGGAWGYVVP